MFNANEINYILDKVSPNFPNKRFIIVCNDNREFDFEYDYINGFIGLDYSKGNFYGHQRRFQSNSNNGSKNILIKK